MVMRPSEILNFTEISLFQIKFKRFSEIIVMRPHKWDADLWDLKSSHVFLNELRTFMVVYLNIKIFWTSLLDISVDTFGLFWAI